MQRRRVGLASAGAVSLVLIAVGARAQLPAGPGRSLEWAPPRLTNRIVLDAPTQAPVRLNLDPARDYVIKLGHVVGPGGVVVDGGHNVVVVGGQVTPEVNTAPGKSASGRAFTFYDQTGTVHIEGVEIDDAGDAFSIQAPKATFQIENVRVVDLHAHCDDFSLNHPDVIQTWSGPAEMRIDGLTAESDYQGFLWSRDPSIPGSIYPRRVLQRNVNVRPSPLQACGSRLPTFHTAVWHVSPSTHFSCESCWMLTGYYSASYRRKLQDSIGGYENADGSYTDPPFKIVHPRHGKRRGRAFPSTANLGRSQGDYIAWPKVPNLAEERWYWGRPAGGDFVPAEAAGIGYVSPGY